MPRWKGQRWQYPASRLLRADLREPLRPYLPDDWDYRAAVDGYEFACAVLRLGSRAEVSPGEFLRKVGNLITEFTRKASEADDQWPWWTAINSPNLQTFAAELTETLKGM